LSADLEFESDRQAIIRSCRALFATGLITGTSGNLSVRHGDRVLITPSGVKYDKLDPEMLPTVSIDGRILSASAGRPSSEVPLHLAVYRHTDAAAIVHTHSPYATAIGLVADELPNVHYAIRALGGAVRVAPYATFGSEELAQNVAEAMTDRRAALMRNHGAIAVGDSIEQAQENAEKLEWLAMLFFRALQIGSPATLTDEELDEVSRQAQTTGYRL
jgi:L-fuculose-phosphate aldolase